MLARPATGFLRKAFNCFGHSFRRARDEEGQDELPDLFLHAAGLGRRRDSR